MTRFAFGAESAAAAEDAAVLAARRANARRVHEVGERDAAEPQAEAVEHGAPRHRRGRQRAGACLTAHSTPSSHRPSRAPRPQRTTTTRRGSGSRSHDRVIAASSARGSVASAGASPDASASFAASSGVPARTDRRCSSNSRREDRRLRLVRRRGRRSDAERLTVRSPSASAHAPCSSALGQHPGRLDELRVVQQHQRLQRRAVTSRFAVQTSRVGASKRDHRRRRRRAPPERVEAAAIQLVARVLGVGLARPGLLPTGPPAGTASRSARRSSRPAGPLAASAASRSISAVSRRAARGRAAGCRDRARSSSVAARLRRLPVRRRRARSAEQRLHVPPPRRRTGRASQSSSSGCVGSRPWLPKLSGVSTRPRPKSCARCG